MPDLMVIGGASKTDKFQREVRGLVHLAGPATAPDALSPELRGIADDVLNAARLSFTATVAQPDVAKGGSVEAALAAIVQQRTPDVRSDAQARAQMLLATDRATKEKVFGRYADFDAESVRGDGFQELLKRAEPLALNPALLGVTEARVLAPESIKAASARVTAPAPAKGTLRLVITSLRCDEDTSEVGRDEMALAGVSIGEKGVITQIGERSVGDRYRAGVEQSLNMRFCEFDLAETGHWPKHLGVTLTLAEKDFGGFAILVQRLWEQNKEEVLKALEKAARNAGKALADYLDAEKFGKQIEDILVSVAKAIVEKAITWIVGLLGDDVFAPCTIWMDLPSISTRWEGGTSSPVMSETYSGHGGQYRLNYQWQLADLGTLPLGSTAQGDTMQSGEALGPDQSITSTSGLYRLVYQGDGNLVLYKGDKPLWNAPTWGSTGFCRMEPNGNFVVYGPDGQQRWASDTGQHPGSRLVVQGDGNVVIYNSNGTPVWASNTWQG